MDHLKIALVHDWLIEEGGSEAVLKQIHQIFPGTIYTLLHNQRAISWKQKIETSFLQKIPFATRFHRFLLPLFPLAIKKFNLSSYDLIISSSHAVAKGFTKKQGQVHICYCHTPMRYIWDLEAFYLQTVCLPLRKIVEIEFNYLKNWDISSSLSVDGWVANSQYIADRIERIYQKKATVIYPPVDVDSFYLSQIKDDYYIVHSRQVPYKRIDLIVKAFSRMPEKKLLVIGRGPEEKKIRALATKNIEILGFIEKPELAFLLSRAKGYIFAAEEDFGISVVEAQSAGLPVIALRKGGVVETVIEGKTGMFFEEPSVENIIEAVQLFEQKTFDPFFIKNHAAQFSQARFQEKFLEFVKEIV